MAAPAAPGAPTPNNQNPTPSPPGYGPPGAPDSSLSQNFQNLQLNPPQNAPTPPSSLPGLPSRPPSFGQSPPFPASPIASPSSSRGPSSVPRPGVPPPTSTGPSPVPRLGVPPTTSPGPSPMSAPGILSPGHSLVPRPGIPPPTSPGPSPMPRLGPPPPGIIPPRGMVPPSGPPQNMVQPNLVAPRPSVPSQGPFLGSRAPPPVSLSSSSWVSPPPGVTPPMPPSSSARPTGFRSPPMSMSPVPPSRGHPRPISNGPPAFLPGAFPGGPPLTSSGAQQPIVGPPPQSASHGPSPRAPPTHTHQGSQPVGNSAPPMPALSQPAPPFQPGPLHVPPSAASFGQSWQTQPRQAAPSPATSSMQPPTMYGMPPPAMNHTGGPVASKVDPSQIPRPIPSSSVVLYDTRQGNQANPPPLATSEYIVNDTGNCSPRYMRCTISQIPCTSDLLTTSGMRLALLVQPLALPHPSEEPIQVVDFGEGGPIRCSRCKGYINPFMKFIDQGRRFVCNFCGFADETPHDYQCNLGPDGRRRDADERPELRRGTVEFVASKDYMVRDPMPAVFFFLVDVSMNAIQTGATAAACSAINQVIADLPDGPRTMVAIATFDSTIHFYNLKDALQQPVMLIVPDVQDVYTPLETQVVVPLSESRQHLELLLENIPTMFHSNMISDSAFGAAMKAAFLAMKSTGGKLLVFQSVLPSAGIGALSTREAEGRANTSSGEKEAHKLLQPADKTLKEMVTEFAEYQVCVDVFLTTQSYIDIASISVVPRITGGQVYCYYPFSALSDTATLYNDLRWNVTRPQGFEAVMRVRCSQGIQVQDYAGHFCRRTPTDVDLPAIDCDKTIMVTLKHDDKLEDGSECAFQCALLYTTVYGQRRIRVMTLSLPCTSTLANLFRSADLDTQFTCFLKQAASQIPTAPLSQLREQVTNHCVNILHSYRKFCSTVQSSGQLILPEALKLLPLYTLALIKSTGLRTDGRMDDRSFWMTYVSSLSSPLAVPLVYPRLISVHDLCSKEMNGSLVPSALPLSSEQISDEGVYLLENGHDALIYIGNSVDSTVLQQLFGFSSVDEIPTQFMLQQYDNSLSKMLNQVINEIRRQRCSYLRLKLCKSGDSSGALFFTYMVEDKTPMGLSYVEFLVHVHRQIQIKMD